MNDPLADPSEARAFLKRHAVRWFAGPIPFDRAHAVCLATVAVGAGRAVDVCGIGETPDDAVRRAAGEAAETMAQVERPGDVLREPNLPRLEWPRDGWLDRRACGEDVVAAEPLGHDAPVAIPADLVLRRGADRCSDLPPLSEGCAAGGDRDAATLGAVLELVERDALARWWRGGRPPLLVGSAVTERLGGEPRCVRLMEVNGGLAPVALAVSNTVRAEGFACAAAARATRAEARTAALRELAQAEMREIALRTGSQDRRGETRAAAARLAVTDADALIGPLATFPGDESAAELKATTARDRLHEIVARGRHCGIVFAAVDLMRADLGVPVVKVVSPQLEPLRAARKSARIRRERASHSPPPAQRRGLTPL